MSDALRLAILAASALTLSIILTGWVRRYALATGMLDRPNERSSHGVETPRGGGAAVCIVTLGATAWLWWDNRLPLGVFLALLGGGGLVALVGFLDDRRGLSPGTRFGAHLTASLLAALEIGYPRELQVGSMTVAIGWGGLVLATLALTWLINLSNFMDGIDGIAGAQASFVLIATALIAPAAARSTMAAGLAAAAASCGFLVWNWPPARIFMGDVGSGFLGFIVGSMTLLASQQDPVSGVWPYLTLSSAFLVDSTMTLSQRVSRGERWWEAHRSHAYQHAAQRWGHRAVTLAFLGINLFWVLPVALLAARIPAAGAVLFLVCILPLTGLAVWQRAGLP